MTGVSRDPSSSNLRVRCSDLHEADEFFVERQRQGLRSERVATLLMEELVLQVRSSSLFVRQHSISTVSIRCSFQETSRFARDVVKEYKHVNQYIKNRCDLFIMRQGEVTYLTLSYKAHITSSLPIKKVLFCDRRLQRAT